MDDRGRRRERSPRQRPAVASLTNAGATWWARLRKRSERDAGTGSGRDRPVDRRCEPVHGPRYRRRARDTLGVPVWYAPLSYLEYVWVSRPGTTHSRNLAQRPQVAIAIYDSHRPGGWSAVYMSCRRGGARRHRRRAERLQPEVRGAGTAGWARAEILPPGEFRLYRATATEQFVLDDHDSRLPVHLEKVPNPAKTKGGEVGKTIMGRRRFDLDGFKREGSSSTSAGEERTTKPSCRRRNRQPVRSSGGRVEATTGLEWAA